MTHIAIIVVAVALVVISSAPTVLSEDLIGVGVSPPEFTIQGALRGGEFEKTITIVNVRNETARFGLIATGDIKDWVSFHEIDNETSINTTQAHGNEYKKIVVKFTIPGDVASGMYSSTIYVQTIPEELTGETSAAAAAVGVKMPVRATIEVTGTQVLRGEIYSISTMDTEINYPLRIKIDFQNTGNVIAKPEITVAITKNGTLIDSFAYSKTEIRPLSREIIPVEWNTTGREAGDYVANASVSLGGDVLAEKDLPFKILETGTLTRQGTIEGLSYDGTLGVGIFVKIIATFENTGEIDSDAQLKGEVYIDGNLADVIESDELTVPAKEEATLTSYLKLEKPGDYTVKGHVIYGGKKTATKETSFNVPDPKEAAVPKSSVPGFESAFAIAGMLLAAVTYLLRRRR